MEKQPNSAEKNTTEVEEKKTLLQKIILSILIAAGVAIPFTVPFVYDFLSADDMAKIEAAKQEFIKQKHSPGIQAMVELAKHKGEMVNLEVDPNNRALYFQKDGQRHVVGSFLKGKEVLEQIDLKAIKVWTGNAAGEREGNYEARIKIMTDEIETLKPDQRPDVLQFSAINPGLSRELFEKLQGMGYSVFSINVAVDDIKIPEGWEEVQTGQNGIIGNLLAVKTNLLLGNISISILPETQGLSVFKPNQAAIYSAVFVTIKPQFGKELTLATTYGSPFSTSEQRVENVENLAKIIREKKAITILGGDTNMLGLNVETNRESPINQAIQGILKNIHLGKIAELGDYALFSPGAFESFEALNKWLGSEQKNLDKIMKVYGFESVSPTNEKSQSMPMSGFPNDPAHKKLLHLVLRLMAVKQFTNAEIISRLGEIKSYSDHPVIKTVINLTKANETWKKKDKDLDTTEILSKAERGRYWQIVLMCFMGLTTGTVIGTGVNYLWQNSTNRQPTEIVNNDPEQNTDKSERF